MKTFTFILPDYPQLDEIYPEIEDKLEKFFTIIAEESNYEQNKTFQKTDEEGNLLFEYEKDSEDNDITTKQVPVWEDPSAEEPVQAVDGEGNPVFEEVPIDPSVPVTRTYTKVEWGQVICARALDHKWQKIWRSFDRKQKKISTSNPGVTTEQLVDALKTVNP